LALRSAIYSTPKDARFFTVKLFYEGHVIVKATLARFSFSALIVLAILSFADAHAFEAIRENYRIDLKQANEALGRNPVPREKASLLRKKAQALDTLGHHSQALDAINESLAIMPTVQASLTKSIILRSLGDLEHADAPLISWVDANRADAKALSLIYPLLGEIHFQRALLSIRRQKWDAAMFHAQNFAVSEPDGYGEVLARYIALRSGTSALPGRIPKSTASPYVELAAMLGGDAPPASFKVIDDAESPAAKAEAQSEVDFFYGVYLRYVAKDEAAATARFRKLADMPWYGSAEQELARFELGLGK
jgi:tetratricopeptide (TPR) repeat protein